ASLFFLLFLCGPSQAAVDHLPVYVALGEAMELPCPLPRVLRGDEFLSWFHSPAAGTSTTQLAQVQVAATVPHFGQTRRDPRLKLLGNYSLWLAESEDADAGRYWCTVLGQHLEYQNWRVYDVSVMRGSQFSARAADGSSCSVLRCSAVPARRLDSVGWREGKGLVRGRAQAFWNEGAALLLVCPGEGHPEPRGRRPRIIRCLMTQDKGISFSLPASADPSPTLCVPSMGWDVPRILMLLLTVGQGFTILALSIVLWRRRVHGVQGQGSRLRCYDCGGGPGGCAEAVTTCGEGERKPQASLVQIRLPGNPPPSPHSLSTPVTLRQHQPACVGIHRCNQVEMESVGDMTYTVHRDCCIGDLCNSAVSSTLAPACVLAAAVTTLTWLLPGLWSG
ncbi:Lymphocyte antigen 6 complex locus protein G6f, partial [Heterocephalus glaber]